MRPIWLLPLALLLAACSREETKKGETPAAPAAAPQTMTTKSGIEMVLVPAGKFTMGDERGEPDAKPAHTVRLGAFYMDACEVTQKSYERLMGKNPSKFVGPDRPVERVSWVFAARYCNMRSRKDGLKPCYDEKTLKCDFAADGYRLPTEAEWEYACRAGTATAFSFGDPASRLGQFAWFKANSGKTTHPVKQKSPNPWGLYDLHGNVAEWCNDAYSETAYQGGDTQDPRGPASGEKRVLRGGNWGDEPDACRSFARYAEAPGFADICFGYEFYGFRCVRAARATEAAK